MLQSLSQFQPQARTKLHQLIETISSLNCQFFGPYELETIIWYGAALTCMLSLAVGEYNDFVSGFGLFGSLVQLHYLILISTKSISARCRGRWAGFVRMLGQRSVMMNLFVFALYSSGVPIKFKVFVGLALAINEIVYVFRPIIPTFKGIIRLCDEFCVPTSLSIGTSFSVLSFIFALFSATSTFFLMFAKLYMSLVLNFPYTALFPGSNACDESCVCRRYRSATDTRLSEESFQEVPITYVQDMSHERCEILKEEMSFWPALITLVFSVAALAFLSMTIGSSFKDLTESPFWPAGHLLVPFIVLMLFQQITQITNVTTSVMPQCLDDSLYFIHNFSAAFVLNFLIPLFMWALSGILGPYVGQYLFVTCLLWSEAHEAFYRYYAYRNPAEWGKYFMLSCLLVIWTMLFDI